MDICRAQGLTPFPQRRFRGAPSPIRASRKLFQAAVTLTALVTLGRAESALARPAQEAPEGATSISLGAVSSPPKGVVMVPLFLTPGDRDTRVGSFSAAIRFDKKSLLFLRAEKSFLLDSVHATFHAQATDDDTHPGQSVVQLDVAAGGAEPQALREGLVLSLVFRVRPDAKPDTTVALPIDRVSAAAPGTPSSPVKPVVGRPGTVEILRPEAAPYVGCFFFTH